MANTADAPQDLDETGTSSNKWVFLSLALALVGIGGGFFAVYSGVVPIGSMVGAKTDHHVAAIETPKVAFVPIPPLIVTLPPEAEHSHLRFSGPIEVPKQFEEDVAFLMPRIQDLMNGYLRALRAADIEGAGAIFRIRLHLLRRIMMVVGEEKVKGLLITEFILR